MRTDEAMHDDGREPAARPKGREEAREERGANLVEYILLVSLIALAVIAAVVFLRGQVGAKFDEAGSDLATPTTGQNLVCGAWVERDEVDPSIVRGYNPCP